MIFSFALSWFHLWWLLFAFYQFIFPCLCLNLLTLNCNQYFYLFAAEIAITGSWFFPAIDVSSIFEILKNFYPLFCCELLHFFLISRSWCLCLSTLRFKALQFWTFRIFHCTFSGYTSFDCKIGHPCWRGHE